MDWAAIENLGYDVRVSAPYTIVHKRSLPLLPELIAGGPVLGTDTSVTGRTSIRIIEPDLMVRTLTHGGAFRNIFKARFLTVDRSLRELDVSAHLISHRILTPEIVGLRIRKQGFFHFIEVITRMIPDSIDLLAYLEKSPDDGLNVIRDTGALIRAVHDARVYHADLHVKNIVLDRGKRPWIIDLDSAYRFIDLPFILKYKNTRRFIHSLKKWDRKERIRLPQNWKQAFFSGYASSAPGSQSPRVTQSPGSGLDM